MTRDEAQAYIEAHPAMFKGYQTNTVLGRIRSFNDPDYYDPTTFVADTAPAPVAAKAKAAVQATAYKAGVPAVSLPTASALPALPITLAIAVLALGAGMTIYKATR